MKRLTALIICLALTLTALPALAARGDKVLFKADYSGGSSASVQSVAYHNGIIYMLDRNTLFTYDGETHSYPYKVPAFNEGAETNVSTMIADEDAVRVLVTEYMRTETSYSPIGMLMYNMSVEPDGTVMFTNRIELDMYKLMEIEEYGSYVREIQNPFIQDGEMVFSTYISSGYGIMAYNLNTHAVKEFFTGGNATSYKDGKILAISRIYENNKPNVIVYEVDLASGAERELFPLNLADRDTPYGYIYEARTNSLYYVLNGELFRIQDMKPETAMGVNVVTGDSDYRSVALTDDGFYVACDYSSVAMYNTDPSARAERRLTVHTSYHNIDDAIAAFTQAHDDVELRMLSSVSSITDAMLTRDDSVDIYRVTADSNSYTSLYARGYLAELTSSEILTQYVSDMYPAIRNVIEKDGELLALPVEIESYQNLGMTNKLMDTLGITKDDMPDTWAEFFEFAKEYPKYAEEYPDIPLFDPYDTRVYIEYALLQNFWRGYLMYTLRQPKENISFDTPEFRQILEGIKAIDYEALGVSDDNIGLDGWAMAEEALIYSYTDVTAAVSFYNQFTPMPLAYAKDTEPVIRATVSLLIVNPYSKNRDLAIEFLELIAQSIRPITLIHLNQHYDEPILNDRYEQQIETMMRDVETQREAMAKADDSEKAEYQLRIDDRLANIEIYARDNKYNASPESIAQYREYAKFLEPGESSGMDNQLASEVNQMFFQYAEGAIDLDTLVKSLDNRLRMILLEGI